MLSGNIVERLRTMAADLDQFRRGKVEDELSEAADVIERLRAEIARLEGLLGHGNSTGTAAETPAETRAETSLEAPAASAPPAA